MGSIAEHLITNPPPARHHGACCSLRLFVSRPEVDEDDRAAIIELVWSELSAVQTAEHLTAAGVTITDQQITKHRRRKCACCKHHGELDG